MTVLLCMVLSVFVTLSPQMWQKHDRVPPLLVPPPRHRHFDHPGLIPANNCRLQEQSSLIRQKDSSKCYTLTVGLVRDLSAACSAVELFRSNTPHAKSSSTAGPWDCLKHQELKVIRGQGAAGLHLQHVNTTHSSSSMMAPSGETSKSLFADAIWGMKCCSLESRMLGSTGIMAGF